MKGISKYIYGVLLILGLLVAGEGEVWGSSFAKLTLSSSPSGGGKVYIGETQGQETTEGSYTIESTLSRTVTFYIKAVPNEGYHFNKWTGDDVDIEKKYNLSTNVKATTGATEASTKSYTVYGNFLENYYAKMNVQKTIGTSGNVTVDGNNGYKNVPNSDSTIVFNLSAPSPNTGYYFSGWTGSNITFGTASSLSTTATVSPSATGGKSNAATYTATANYAPYYYAKLNVSATTGASGSPTGGGTNQVTTSGGSTTFTNLTAKAASAGYHFAGWTGTGISFSAASSFTTNATVAASTTATGTATYNATANYALDFYATLNIKTTSGTSGTATGAGTSGTATSEGDVVFNVVAPDANSGYHFTGWSGSGITFGNSGSKSTTATVKAAATGGSDKATTYLATANYAANYYIKVNSVSNPAAGGASYVSYGTPFSGTATSVMNGSGQGWSDYQETFSIKTVPASNYHFTGWTTSGGTLGSTSATETTLKAKTTSGHTGTSNPTVYTVTANYEENIYYAKLSATSGGHGTVSVDAGTKSTKTKGGDIEFTLTVTPDAGYHMTGITFTEGSGSVSGNKVTVKASDNYAISGDDKASSYKVNVTFAENHFYAKLTTDVSTAGTGNTGTAQVSADGGTTYAGNATKSASTSGGNVTFHIKATPNTGYQFKGWSETNGSTSYKSTTAETDYTVKGHTTEGQTQAYNLYAVFNHGTYKVHFVANGGTGSMADQTFTHGTAQNLTQNSFVNNFTVTYDVQGGTAISPETKSRFNGWLYNSTTYADKASVNLTVAHNSTLDFTAQWKSSVDFTLPTPTKKAADGTTYAFLGWYDAATGGNKVGDAGATVSISSTRTLYAHWQDYNILIKASWSSVSTGDKAVFSVTRSGNPAITYYISVPIGGSTASKTLKDVVPGEWTVTPVTQWTWNYNKPDAQTKTLTAGPTTFEFSFISKLSTKKHDEKSGTVTP